MGEPTSSGRLWRIVVDLGIRHALLIANIHVKLPQLARSRAFTLSSWVEAMSLWDRETASNNVVVPIRPDALFTIAWPREGESALFLEADRGTMAHSRMREKVSGHDCSRLEVRLTWIWAGFAGFLLTALLCLAVLADGLWTFSQH
jgi:hypothetical protein